LGDDHFGLFRGGLVGLSPQGQADVSFRLIKLHVRT
jgi:hypothetical protein